MATPLEPLSTPAPRPEPRPDRLLPDGYITDGRRLFRVVSRFAADQRPRVASLEDCLTLRVRTYSPGELAAMKLRPVRSRVGRA